MTIQKKVLMMPLNAVGHINATLSIADRLKADFNYRIVYLMLGPTVNSIEKHGHELVVIDEKTGYEDFEEEQQQQPVEGSRQRQVVEEDNQQVMDKQQHQIEQETRVKRLYPGYLKWPRVVVRLQQSLQRDPIQGAVNMTNWTRVPLNKDLIDNHEEIRRAIDAIDPDLIIFDNVIPPLCVLQQESTRPWVQLRSANSLPILESKLVGGVKPTPFLGVKLHNKQERARLQLEEPEKWQQMLLDWKKTGALLSAAFNHSLAPIREHLESNGCYRLKSGANYSIDSPYLNIYLCPEELDYDVEDDILEYRPVWFRCNSLIRKTIIDKPRNGYNHVVLDDDAGYWQRELERGMRGKQEMVLFSLGSIVTGDQKMIQKYLDMLWDDDKRLYVVSKGINGDRFELNPDNMIGANYIPQTWFLERAKLAIIHGGNNGITECMHYGVPMIVLPCFEDQLDNAQRVDELNLGRRLDLYRSSKLELRQTIDELSRDDKLHQRMRAIGQRMRQRDDVGKISMMLRRLVEEKKLSPDYIEQCRDRSYRELALANGFCGH